MGGKVGREKIEKHKATTSQTITIKMSISEIDRITSQLNLGGNIYNMHCIENDLQYIIPQLIMIIEYSVVDQ